MSQEKQLFTQRIQINPNIFNDIKQDLSPDADITAICNKYKSYETTSWTAKFDDGYEMDIKFCCGNTHDTESNPLWMESVLFNNGYEVTHSEVEEDFHQTWELETESAIYRVECETQTIQDEITNAMQEELTKAIQVLQDYCKITECSNCKITTAIKCGYNGISNIPSSWEPEEII